ncbi:MAG TPA: adenosylcobalamin-dependent ribonucleoside-diphosphate reductase [Hydrogenophaga sp.]|jgi:ribonucleoside-diphosphate reductase alpha chain|uniref:adenosylcobalamin-dependent ribonucleoside-diphosphate reductase n=1 Tax=Hydrogenophaga TaxID=47420 RepID=UPI0008AEA90E|nr:MULTISPECIES: adenosylcobalamin-dependent ribonucleoside-diphosphate reductase [Hydrogenophaga]OGA77700.1 MAG: ribonucleoside-diphosphate reductase, adenosylcobalamin-dependent [Burkholderiales bacterium GWE1_65_30]OGA89714.1 MAG: ribonucleoside-diphosphate reductase, adenosylcobalamin-dependent [Burkholderiales bacterium GWF1_66_17]MBW8314646.1 adenosylcobalamin-dependent ribonucleoside-diphosphate reductase [Hydrogenophaga sp.]UCU94079.1 adenosylcobalamin-dependent ribonucleoside-diphospha
MKRDNTMRPQDLTATQPISQDVLAEKYLKPGESGLEDLYRRVARALASVEKEAERAEWEQRFLDNLHAGAIGAGRIMSAAGTDIQATLINCFVQPVGDAIQGVDAEGYPGIYEALREAAETMRRGGGVGYDFSRIRPKGAEVKGTHSMASGPCSYINVFDQSCSTVESAGARRGAQMGVLRIDHPDVMEFITAKRTPGRWNNFNVSVGVSDAFMEAVGGDQPWELVHKARPGKTLMDKGAYQRSDGMWVYQTLSATELWDTIMKSAYDFAEPGILFLDKIGTDNNLHYCETIAATNPCGEQPLPPYGCCDLGPIILTRFVKNPFGFGGVPAFDFEAFEQAVATQVRALDNVLDVTFWPLEQQRAESAAKRRIGVGFTGMGNALAMLCVRYDREEGRAMAAQIAERMRNAAYLASVELGKEKGVFPKFDAEGYLAPGTFASRLPDAIKKAIRKNGLRNSHLLSIAPTGTVSLAFADNASNGIEPPFSWMYRRKKREADGSTSEYAVEDHAWRLYRELGGDVDQLPDYFVNALAMSAGEHIAMMEAVQPFVDTAISKTVNVAADYPFEDFKSLYQKAWRANLKGMATYRPNSILGSVLDTGSAATDAKAAAAPAAPAPVDPMRTVIESRPKGALSAVADKIEYWTQEGHKTLYIVVSFLPVPAAEGNGTVERAIEFFMPVGQNGESQQWITSTMRMLSLAARGGFLERALSDMRKVAWDRGPVRLGTYQKADGTHVPMWHDSEVAAIAFALQNIIARRAQLSVVATAPAPAMPELTGMPSGVMAGKKCPECGAHAMIRKDGCDYCTQCGHLGTCG